MLEGIGAAGRTDFIRDAIGHGIAERWRRDAPLIDAFVLPMI